MANGRHIVLSGDELALLTAVFWRGGLSRAEVAARLDVSRSKANALLSSLSARDLLAESGTQPSTGGRRPEVLSLSAAIGVFAAIDIGATSLDVALLAPDMTVLAHHAEPADVRNPPTQMFARARDLLRALLRERDLSPTAVRAIGVGVPGPVAFETGQLVEPPLMPGWQSFSIRECLAEDYDAPVFVDNDVNLLALGTLWQVRAQLQNFIVIKIGTGIGCGIICHGALYRGADGSAGDVGHICVDPNGPRCPCGNVGCVEAMAAGPALGRMATEVARSGRSGPLQSAWLERGALSAIDLGDASRAGDPEANRIIQQAGAHIGEMLASVINFFNPSHVFVGGGVAQIGPSLLAAIRHSVYRRSLALSTRHLDLRYMPNPHTNGILGAGVLAIQEALLRPALPRPASDRGRTPPNGSTR
jgi:predicted NBD/HSP70 family sugar kinase